MEVTRTAGFGSSPGESVDLADVGAHLLHARHLISVISFTLPNNHLSRCRRSSAQEQAVLFDALTLKLPLGSQLLDPELSPGPRGIACQPTDQFWWPYHLGIVAFLQLHACLIAFVLTVYKIVGKWRSERPMKKQYAHGAYKLYKINIKIGITRHTKSSKSLASLGLTGI